MPRLPAVAHVLAGLILLGYPGAAHARVIIQYFETDWAEIQSRLPELAIAGYDALWMPPPQKGAEGTRDVGFSVYDRFDLGDQDQRGTVPTRYGTRDQLLDMCDGIHRFGMRLFFDVVMNHNANPALIENQGVDLPVVPLDGFPDTVPLDYHVLPGRPAASPAGAYEVLQPAELGGGTFVLAPESGWENPEPTVAAVPMPAEIAAQFPGWTHLVRAPRIVFDFDPLSPEGLFEVQSYSLLGLADFALDMDGVNATLAGVPLPRFVRQPDCPACYPGGVPVEEDIIEYIVRWVLWLANETDADGFRLDAVKHASTDFFAYFDQAIQDDYDARRGLADADDKDVVDDAQLFGESFTGDIFGELKPYWDSGMQLLNFPLFFRMGGLLGDGGGNGDLGQLSYPQGGADGAVEEFGGLGRLAGVSFAQSHDSLPPGAQPNLAYAFILSRVGDAVVFFDGNNYDPRSFVAPGRPDALGDLSSRVITDLIYVHNHFARGGMWNRFVDDDVYVYERAVAGGTGPTLLAVLHDNIGADGRVGPDGVARFGEFDSRPLIVTAFRPGTVLVDYTGNSPVHEVTVLDPTAVAPAARDRALAEFDRSSDFPPPSPYGLVYLAVPSGPSKGYAMYAPKVPAGPANGARPVSILQADQRVEDVTLRTAGEKRTAAGARVAARTLTVPRVTGRTITVRARTDATAAQVYLSIDAGGAALAGRAPVTGTPERALDGMVEMAAAGTAGDGELLWEVAGVDASLLADGVHVLRVRAVRTEGDALLWNTFVVPFLVDLEPGGSEPWEPLDRDGDGVPTSEDSCPDLYNPDQGDYDGDGRGDLCDYCPLDGPAPMLDGDGCRALEQADRDAIELVAAAVLEGNATIGDLVAKVDEVNGANP